MKNYFFKIEHLLKIINILNMAGRIFIFLISKGRIFFGVLFLAPLLSQFLNYNKIENILGMPTLIPCLFIGFFWGLYATIKGRWFWF